MGFIKTVLGLFRPSFYFQEIRHRSVMRGAGFLFVWTLIVCGVVALHFCLLGLEKKETVLQFGRDLEGELDVLFPAELVLTFKDFELSTNVPEPYYIDFQTEPFRRFFPIGQEWFDHAGAVSALPEKIEHLLAIDSEGAAENFDSYKSLALLTRSAVVFPDKNASVKVMFFRDVQDGRFADFVIDRAKYDEFVVAVKPVVQLLPDIYSKAVIAAALFVPILFAAFWVPWQMLYLVVFSFVLLVLAKVLGRALAYREVYVLSLYASAFPVAGIAAMMVMGVALPPFVFSVILLCVLGSVLFLGENREASR